MGCFAKAFPRNLSAHLLHPLHAPTPLLALCSCITQLESEYAQGRLSPGLYKEAAAPKTYINNMVRTYVRTRSRLSQPPVCDVCAHTVRRLSSTGIDNTHCTSYGNDK